MPLLIYFFFISPTEGSNQEEEDKTTRRRQDYLILPLKSSSSFQYPFHDNDKLKQRQLSSIQVQTQVMHKQICIKEPKSGITRPEFAPRGEKKQNLGNIFDNNK